ncbi:related to beta-1,6-glucanase precursor [Ustilago trichophora]|uniref:Related to beta-1,6-glucanase n=1 Tax=Ustilago trichophora TaxID=86804 RepID=A0A5C3E9B1_9BASI|nr:related to beta-1,6-glucanase precursor [Ustilago trichophora]
MRGLPILIAFVAASARMALCADPVIVIDKLWSTTWDMTKVQELSNPAIHFVPGAPLTASVNVTADDSGKGGKYDQIGITITENRVHQAVDAFGGGITDSVAITLQDFKSKHPKDYDDLLHLLFSQDAAWFAKGGVGINTVRVPLGACDFGVSPYTYDDTADGSEDPNLELFTIKKAPKLWKTLADIVAINPGLKIVTAAWSAPGWMKENANPEQPLFGGNLKSGMEEVYAKYLVKAVTTIKKEENLDIFAMSLLNEPQIPELKYPTMKLSSDQAIKVGKLVRAGLDKAGMKNLMLLAWDHNWDNTEYPLTVLDGASDAFGGVAWHGYGGDPSAQKVVADAYPNLECLFTEFTQITQYFSEPYKNMKNTARNLLIGSIRYMSRSVILWNLVLRKDEDGFTTPHLPNVCLNCNAAILLLPESTDANLNAGDPNHTKTLAEANGATAATTTAADDKEDPAKKKPAPTTPEKPEKPENPTVRKRSLSRRASEGTTTNTFKPVVPAPGTDGTDASTGLTAQAVPASKIVDVKKTGNSAGYTSSLFKRTSDMLVLSHLSTAVRPTGESKSYSKRIEVTSTDELTELGGRVLAQAFRQDGVKPGVSRFSVILLNQNDHYETGVFEAATAVVAFRGMIASITTEPGLYTFSWEAPTVAPEALPLRMDCPLGRRGQQVEASESASIRPSDRSR